MNGTSCGNTDNALNIPKGERVLADWLDKQDLHPDQVHCPSGVTMELGSNFVCKAFIANAGGMVLDIEVTTISETGDVRFRHLSDKLVSQPVERSLRGRIKDQTGRDVSIQCGLRVRPLIAGSTFTCALAPPLPGGSKKFEVTMLSTAPYWAAKLRATP